MASTRFSRANLTAVALEEDEPHRHETTPPAIDFAGRIARRDGNAHTYVKPQGDGAVFPNFGGEGEFARPEWQDYFFLAPNVRFTRTPDREIKKIKPEDEHHEPVEQAAGSISQPRTPAPAVTARPASAEPRAAAPSPQLSQARRVVDQTPAAPVAPSPGAPIARAAPTVATPAAAATVQAATHQPAAKAAAPRRSARWSYISDHAFFEFASGFVPQPTTAPAPVSAPAVPVKAEVPAARLHEPRPVVAPDATSLYRVIEVSASMQLTPVETVKAPAAVVEAATSAVETPAAVAISANRPVAANDAAPAAPSRTVEITMPAPRQSPSLPMIGEAAQVGPGDYELPSEELLQLPPEGQGFYMSQERLEQNADLLESVLEDFGVKGEIIHVRPGPVVTLYEFEPAPGVKSSRVIGLADDIARSMSAISARVAVIPGRNVIGIELPNETRETVYFRELIESDGFRNTGCKLALCLGKTIGGEPVIAELAKMPHLLVAGTTGSGKSVAINTMILSLLYRLKPEECRLIMVDPKMLELSIYDGIPHLLTPVVTDPKKAVTALKWAVREMEDRYRKMARLGVRNIDGYNQRAAVARDKGEVVVMQVQTGFEKGTGAPVFEEQEIDLAPMPYIVVIVDEMADLMMVAGKEIEGAIQRLAQMARAAGIHLIMATQRPSVDVITGTIKANFPTRISFQVTSKIDSRTILGEQGAEQLLGQGDMLHMAGGGRIARVHGPFVSDAEVEHVVNHLKAQGRPEYLETVTADEEEELPEVDDSPVFDKSGMGAEDGDNLYDEAVKVVLRDKKCSTSYIQRRLGIGYNRAASIVERMEQEGIVGEPNHVGKREIIR
ncbi:DNA translocase FtsK [Mesorhizobium sp. 1M-11]|uniref:DNA translocase FtsK n=1 Tax=Mesorhizobium sp. 1M-11 TaxID=1529006 RepID=UPI0006C73FCC|nr:DNA translocase FtsK [Mesorhizobium sp. 1M-11]